MKLKRIFTFPNPINEVSARIVGGGVALMVVAAIATDSLWLIAVIAYGYVVRALAGPTFSPLGQLATRVITPRLPVEPRWIAGPPKRFAQTLGGGLALASLASAFLFGRTDIAYMLLGVLGLFATLESVFSFCVGCKIFGVLMRLGLIPEPVCASCANIWERRSPRDGAGAATYTVAD